MEENHVEEKVKNINCATFTGYNLPKNSRSFHLVVGVLMGKTLELSNVSMSSL